MLVIVPLDDTSHWKNTQVKRIKDNSGRVWKLWEMMAAVTAGGENEWMGGFDLVNLMQRCKTNCWAYSRKLGQAGRAREAGRARCVNDDEWGGKGEMLTGSFKSKMSSKSSEESLFQGKEYQKKKRLQQTVWGNDNENIWQTSRPVN